MTTLEIILIAVIWLFYGVFNSGQHDLHEDFKDHWALIFTIIVIVRGIFFWKGDY